ncbi:unnamed protein product [Lactuca virosa]|uniref:Uncharacterized protein n=1 Tax=Lactuca virosa TaxID=75947 RepID=A0AAU9PL05_9ASTR|nr:unnamed protein product [Lactuca virosa]
MSSDENMNETISSPLTMKETTPTVKHTYKRKTKTNQKGKKTNISDKDSPTMRETRSMQKNQKGKKIFISDKDPTTMIETDLKRKNAKDIPPKLGFYILQKFDSERMLIDIEGKELKLFYADNIHSEDLTVTRKCPTICYWSLEKIRYRETFEQEECRFGLGELNEEFVNEQDEGDTDLEDSDSDKDEDHSVEGNGEEDNDNDESQPEVDYLLDSNEAENEGIKNDGDKNKKEGETEVKEKDGKNNENDNDEEKKMMMLKKQIIMKRLFNKLKMKICWIKLLTTLWIMSLELDFQV